MSNVYLVSASGHVWWNTEHQNKAVIVRAYSIEDAKESFNGDYPDFPNAFVVELSINNIESLNLQTKDMLIEVMDEMNSNRNEELYQMSRPTF